MVGNRDLERGTAEKGRNQRFSADVDYSERQWTSWLVPMIVVGNVAMFVVIMSCLSTTVPIIMMALVAALLSFLAASLFSLSGRTPSSAPLPLRGLFCCGIHKLRLDKLGALEWNKIVHQNQAWRLVSCIWLHAGLIHLLANMLSLVFIGIRLEQQFGFVRVGLIYLLSGIGGSILSSLFIQNIISVGASGTLFGLLGAMLSELLTNWTIYANKVSLRVYDLHIGKIILWFNQTYYSGSSVYSRDHHCNKSCCPDSPTRRQLCSHQRVLDRVTLGIYISGLTPVWLGGRPSSPWSLAPQVQVHGVSICHVDRCHHSLYCRIQRRAGDAV
ncbi:hypothetical protein SASPL_109865 [Salvia splendens]|uniref:RHOMBOID-like protein n=1 Tax=Salvia splendens TaxID=180675 RepID=A0A8X8YJJ4_SALSN|nr:hypothetical protein SASPL_109865 [Salvia splendens]